MSIQQFFLSHFNTAPTATARAPGRLEFIGNHLDYNGGPVLGAAIDKYVTVAVSPRNDDRIVLVSEAQKEPVETTLAAIAPAPNTSGASWGNYPLGMFKVLRDAGLHAAHGFNLAVVNDLPIGAGLSSSAAIELATGYALAALYHFPLDPKTAAILGRAAENTFVGMPCGILDQGCVAFGKAGSLVLIDCEKNEFSTRPIPDIAHFWLFNTHKKHALIDSLYATRNRECMEATAILQQANPGLPNLAAATEAQVRASARALGRTRAKRAYHVVQETARVRSTLSALDDDATTWVGFELTASHKSSRDLFENSCKELDYLVELLTAREGVFGARLSGGGFGGTVMALTDDYFSLAAASTVAAIYADKFGQPPTVFHTKTGDGAALL